MPFLMKPWRAIWYASWMPEAPAVEPPAVSCSMALRIFALSRPEVGSSTTRDSPAYTTSDTRSCSRNWSTSSLRVLCTSGRPSRRSMEPETSTRNTRLAGANSATVRSEALMPMRSRRVWGFQGDGAISVVTPNGEPSPGRA